MRGDHRKDGGSCNQMRVNRGADPRALVRGVKAVPSREEGKLAVFNRKVQEGDNHGRGGE